MRRVAFAVIGLLVASTGAGFCQDIASLRSMLAAKFCPPNEYQRITYDSRNCGDNAFHSCNQQYAAQNPGWRSCYTELHACHKKIDEDNQVIDEANRIHRSCQPRQTNEGYAARPDPRGNGSASGQSDLARRLADQDRNKASADAARRQDEQFDNTVRATQQRYQEYQSQQEANRQAAAQEQERQRDRERRAREQTQSRQDTSGGWNCFSNYRECLSNCRAVKGWNDNGICGGRCSDGGIGNDPTPPGIGNCWK
ncbi:MAG: hypothetical protein FWD68_20050 [Alphaproteobacteria bacterium]|nr:hypothetical protein [Alphaproteobacteria bacterium]